MVGASGILAPLGADLQGLGMTVWAVSRGAVSASFDATFVVDTRNVCAVSAWMEQLPADPDLLIAYSPAVAAEVWSLWRGWVARLVVVATSEWASPEAPPTPWPSGDRVSLVQLGWRPRTEKRRWHTPEEVSDVVLRVVTQGFPAYAQLGRLLPWEDRPR